MDKTLIKLELTLSEVNGVMSALSAMPYGQVVGLIDKIKEQAVPQVPMPNVQQEPQAVGL